MPRILALVLLLVLLTPGAAQAEGRLGVVLVHGKNGSPDKNIVEIARVLRNVGFLVLTPEMPWSKKRGFDATYQQSLVEIGAAVQELKVNGAAKVALVGHGLGANAALGYAATRGGIFALAALAPGHDPDRNRDVFLADVRKARQLVLSNGGATRSLFTDLSQGKDYDLSTTAEVYLSYNDPDGQAVMPRNAAALNPAIPLLWVVGEFEPSSRLGRSYCFAKAPPHPKSSYEQVPGDYHKVPQLAANLVAEWLRDLMSQQ